MFVYPIVQCYLELNFYCLYFERTLLETLKMKLVRTSKRKATKQADAKKRRKRVETEKDIEEYLALLSAKSLNGFTPE